MPLARFGFFLGCSLSLTDPADTQEIFSGPAGFREWTKIYSENVADLGQRVSNCPIIRATYEDLFPESVSHLVTQEDASKIIARQVFAGLIFGANFRSEASSMLETWVQRPKHPKNWEPMAEGGVWVDDSSALSSAYDARKYARSVFLAWQDLGHRKRVDPSPLGDLIG